MTKDILNLIEVYKNSLNDKNSIKNSRSIHWQKILKNNEKFLKIENIKNFRKKRILSEGLDDAMNEQNKLDLLDHLSNFDINFLKKSLPDKNVGNSNYSHKILGYYIDYSIIHHLKWYEKIHKYIFNQSTILEIGGGFGSLARIILKNNDVKYFLIDLPEVNLICNYYLQNHFPEKKIFNYKNFIKGNLKNEINNYDIFILPPNIIENEEIKFNFIINTRSFMEMTYATIQNYFKLIHKRIHTDGYFLNINKYVKSTVGEDIKFSNYPYDKFWQVILSEKSFLQKNQHFLLTKRCKSEGNIDITLNDLKSKEFIKNDNKILNIIHLFKKITYNLLKKICISVLGPKK